MLKSLLSDLVNPVAECSVARSLRSKLRIYSMEAISVQNQCGRYLLVKWEFSKKFFKKDKAKKEENKHGVKSSDIQSEEVAAPTETTESISIDISKQTYKELTRIKEKNDCNNFDDVINGIIESLKDYQDNSENKGRDEKNG